VGQHFDLPLLSAPRRFVAALALGLAVSGGALAAYADAAYDCRLADSNCTFYDLGANSSVTRTINVTNYGLFMHNKNNATCKRKEIITNTGAVWPGTTDYTCASQIWSTWFTGPVRQDGVSSAAGGRERFVNTNGGLIRVNGGGLY